MVRISDRGRATLRDTDLLKGDLMARIVSRLDDPKRARLALAMTDLRDATHALLAEEGLAPGGPHEHPRPSSRPASHTH
jgi:hypothetical protein